MKIRYHNRNAVSEARLKQHALPAEAVVLSSLDGQCAMVMRHDDAVVGTVCLHSLIDSSATDFSLLLAHILSYSLHIRYI